VYEVELQFMLSCLQRRLANGNKHILTYFQHICHTLINKDWSDIVSSMDSTLPKIHREFGTVHPTQEMYRLLLRPDYSLRVAMINDSAWVGMMRRLNEEPWERYYHPRRSIPTLKEASVKGSDRGVSISQDAAPPVDSEPKNVRFPAPALLSVVH
jgi:hypothetical protein